MEGEIKVPIEDKELMGQTDFEPFTHPYTIGVCMALAHRCLWLGTECGKNEVKVFFQVFSASEGKDPY